MLGYRLEKVCRSAQSAFKCGLIDVFFWGYVDLVYFCFNYVFDSVSVLVVIVPHAFILLRKHIKCEITVASINFTRVSLKPVKVQLVANLHAD